MLRQRLLRSLAGVAPFAEGSWSSCVNAVPTSSVTTSARCEDGEVTGSLTASTSRSITAVPQQPSPSLVGGSLSFQQPLTAHGKRAADPGEPKYGAPFWVPVHVRRELKLPNVLFVDPWRSAEDPELRRRHAKLCFDFLCQAGQPLTAQQVFDGVNAQNGPTFGHPSYVRMLLENMRKNRMVYGKRNPDSKLGHGMPYHPRLYTALAYQAEELGAPSQLARRQDVAKAKSIAHAFKRLRNSKPPYRIFRQQAHVSVLQWAQAQEALRQQR